MPTATRTGRQTATPSRFGRTPAPQGRFGRPSAPQGRYARSAAHRGQGLRRRRPNEPKGMKKMLGAVGSMLPGAAAKKAAPSSKKGKAGGLALAAAAAGMAFKNRDKLGQLRHRNDGATTGATTPEGNHAASTPSPTPMP